MFMFCWFYMRWILIRQELCFCGVIQFGMLCVFLPFSCIIITSLSDEPVSKISGVRYLPNQVILLQTVPRGTELHYINFIEFHWAHHSHWSVRLGLMTSFSSVITTQKAQEALALSANHCIDRITAENAKAFCHDIYAVAEHHSAVSVTFFVTLVIYCVHIDTHRGHPLGQSHSSLTHCYLTPANPDAGFTLHLHFLFISQGNRVASSPNGDNSGSHHGSRKRALATMWHCCTAVTTQFCFCVMWFGHFDPVDKCCPLKYVFKNTHIFLVLLGFTKGNFNITHGLW